MARRDVLAWVIAEAIWGQALWSRDQMEECYRIADAVTPVFTKTGDGAADAVQVMGGSLPLAAPSSPTEDGAVTPPADPHGQPVGAGGDQAAESATGATNTVAASSSSPSEPGPVATIGGQPGPAVPRRFQLYRHTDISHVSGIGVVAWGAQFPDGSVAVRWHGDHPSTVAWNSIDDAIAVHGHSGATEVRWLDEEPIDLWPAEGGNHG